MRSFDALLQASGYPEGGKDFADLIKILDSEVRLITPTDPEGLDKGRRTTEHSQPVASASAGGYFQLTHDYLVPSLREWLTRKQKENPQRPCRVTSWRSNCHVECQAGNTVSAIRMGEHVHFRSHGQKSVDRNAAADDAESGTGVRAPLE